MIVAVDVETTGLTPHIHDLVEIAIVPLNNDFTVNEGIPIFHQRVKPEHWDTITQKALEVNGETRQTLENNPTRLASIKAFTDWHSTHVKVQMVPLAQNWSFDKAFISAWLDPHNNVDNVLDRWFNYHARDTMAIGLFLCDRARSKNMKLPFGSVSLTAMCKTLGVEHKNNHSALGDALACAALYRRFIYGA